jgi:hypothetical protein
MTGTLQQLQSLVFASFPFPGSPDDTPNPKEGVLNRIFMRNIRVIYIRVWIVRYCRRIITVSLHCSLFSSESCLAVSRPTAETQLTVITTENTNNNDKPLTVPTGRLATVR